jgi:hypothetical protein
MLNLAKEMESAQQHIIPLLVGAGLGVAGAIGQGIAAASAPDAPKPYNVDKNAFDYAGEPNYYRSRGENVRRYNLDRTNREIRDESLGRIRGYQSQAQDLQRAGMENARLQQLAMAGGASPSARAAAMRAAQMGSVQAQQGIAQGARQHMLAEHQAQLAALQGLRGGDLQDELQRQAYQMDKERLARMYELQAQQDRQYAAQMSADAERTQAAAYGQAIPAQAAAAQSQYGAMGNFFGNLTNAGGGLLTYGMLANAGGGGSGGGGNAAAMAGTPYAPGASASGQYGNWSF